MKLFFVMKLTLELTAVFYELFTMARVLLIFLFEKVSSVLYMHFVFVNKRTDIII